MRPHRDPRTCDACDAPHDQALPTCAGVNCEMRVCHRCRTPEWLCPECAAEQPPQATPSFATELFTTAQLLATIEHLVGPEHVAAAILIGGATVGEDRR